MHRRYLRNFLSKLSDDNLLDHYNIIFASDHGARNLNISKFFYSYCDNKDILDNIYQFYNEKNN